MAYMFSHHLIWWLLALALGLIIGWMTCGREPTRWWVGWVPWGAAAAVIGAVLAMFRILPDRQGYMLDLALTLFGSYIVGCCIGCLIKQWLGSKDTAPVAVAAAPAAVQAAPLAPAAKAPEPQPVSVPPPAAAPAAAAGALDAGAYSGNKPKTLAAPRGGKADDLKRIRGIGRQNEGRLHALGIWHFDQIAEWNPAEVEWVGGYLAFPGRIDREGWVAQAKVLATGAETEFSKRVARGEVETSKDAGDKGQGNVADLSAIDRKPPTK